MRELTAHEIEEVEGGLILLVVFALKKSAEGYAKGVENGSLSHMYMP